MKYISAILAIMFLMGCSSKIVSYDGLGRKHIVTKSIEDTFHEQQPPIIIEKDVVLVEPYIPKE